MCTFLIITVILNEVFHQGEILLLLNNNLMFYVLNCAAGLFFRVKSIIH